MLDGIDLGAVAKRLKEVIDADVVKNKVNPTLVPIQDLANETPQERTA